MGQAIPIFVINLAAAVERRKRIEAHLTALGLEYEILPATDGRALSDEQLAQIMCAETKHMTIGAIGCYVSHVDVYKRILATGQPAGLLLEDDARLSPEIVPLLVNGPKSYEFDYLFLEVDMLTVRDEPVFFSKDDSLDLGFGIVANRLSAGPRGAHALLMTRELLLKRIACAYPIILPVDTYYHLPGNFGFHGLVHRSGASLSEDSLVSFTKTRDQRAKRPSFSKLRKYRWFAEMAKFLNPEYRLYRRLAAKYRKQNIMPPNHHWSLLSPGARIIDVTNEALDVRPDFFGHRVN